MILMVRDRSLILGGAIAGVALCYVWGNWVGVGTLMVCLLLCFLALKFRGYPVSFFVVFGFLLAGGIGYGWALHFEKQRAREITCPRGAITGTVVGFRDGTSGRTPLVQPEGQHHKILIYTDEQLLRGQDISVMGSCSLPEAFVADNGREVPYDRMLWARGVTAQVYANQIEVGKTHGGRFVILRGLDRSRDVVTKVLQRSLSPGNAALAGGLFVGSREGTPDEDKTAFQAAGLSHIVVLSGYNITLVARMVMVMSALVVGFWLRRVFATIAVIFLVILSGAEPPAVRAGIMGIIGLGAAWLGRKTSALWMVMLAATLFVFQNPRSLLYDLSFQLSVAATIGVIFLAPRLLSKLSSISEKFGLRQLLSETLAAQVMTLPLIWYAIGTWPLLGIVMNLLIVPFVPLATLLAALTSFVGLLSANLGFFIGSISSLLFSGIRGAAQLVSHAQFAVIQLPALPGWLAAVMFVMVCALLIYKNRTNV